VFDLYQNEEKAQQTYTAGLGLESRLSGAWRLSGRYRGITRVPLGPESTVADRFNPEFGVNVSWDPTRERAAPASKALWLGQMTAAGKVRASGCGRPWLPCEKPAFSSASRFAARLHSVV